MAGHEWEAILALSGVIYAGGIAIIRYLLQQISLRDQRIEKLTESSAAANQVNAQLAAKVPDLILEIQRLRAGGEAP